jgi:peptidyl-prolyl cis-trans isomerase C
LLPTKAAATDAIARLKKKLTLDAFTKAAREESLDKATFLRAGSLGMVAPDGTSNFAHVRADKAVIDAARSVKDGELVPTPVAEGEHFAVIWRRGTVAATQVSLEAASDEIRQTLWRQRFELKSKARIDSLRAANVKRVNDGLVAEMDPPRMAPPMVVRNAPSPQGE